MNDVILHHLYASAVHPPIRHHAAAMVDFSAPLTIPAADGTAATHSDACNSTCSSITHVNDVILHHLHASASHLRVGQCAHAMMDSSARAARPNGRSCSKTQSTSTEITLPAASAATSDHSHNKRSRDTVLQWSPVTCWLTQEWQHGARGKSHSAD